MTIDASASVAELADRRAAALATADWEVVAGQLHPRFVYVNAQGIRLTRHDYLEFVERGPLRWIEQRLDDVSVVVVGSTAVLTSRVTDDVMVDDARHVLTFKTTQTYVREEGRWSYLAGHTAAILQ